MLALVAVSAVLTVALTFSTLEIISTLDHRLEQSAFPDISFPSEQRETFMSVARPIGYACLGAVGVLILVGFLIRRTWISSAGTVAFFLPTFGDFALQMFFFAGLGVLRVAWLPLSDYNFMIYRLGDIAYLPGWALEALFRVSISTRSLGMWRPDLWLPWSCIAAGLFVFFVGTVTWLHGKLKRETVFGGGIYRYTRHPQYLGFILWSYGILLLTLFEHGGWYWGGWLPLYPSFPWVLSTLAIVCVALAEECTMVRRAGDAYRAYRDRTAFLIPLPRVIARAVTLPHRLMLRKTHPENLKEILCVFIIYCTIIAALSYVTHVSGVLSQWYMWWRR
jgi:protein-S-isoprenylcysteine O-methyltransferase Ste14